MEEQSVLLESGAEFSIKEEKRLNTEIKQVLDELYALRLRNSTLVHRLKVLERKKQNMVDLRNGKTIPVQHFDAPLTDIKDSNLLVDLGYLDWFENSYTPGAEHEVEGSLKMLGLSPNEKDFRKIKIQFRRCLINWHPDKSPEDITEEEKERMVEVFKLICEGYQTLKQHHFN